MVIHAKLPPEAGALVVKAIATPEQEEQQEALKQARNSEPKSFSAETLSMKYTRANALARMAEHFIATAGQNPQLKGLKGSERCQLVLHVDINTLRQHGSSPGPSPGHVHEHCHTDNNRWLAPPNACAATPAW